MLGKRVLATTDPASRERKFAQVDADLAVMSNCITIGVAGAQTGLSGARSEESSDTCELNQHMEAVL
jgi:hypothetical protein